jgi:hypothetical protein
MAIRSEAAGTHKFRQMLVIGKQRRGLAAKGCQKQRAMGFEPKAKRPIREEICAIPSRKVANRVVVAQIPHSSILSCVSLLKHGHHCRRMFGG